MKQLCCPIHNLPLTINRTELDVLGYKYKIITGNCPKCQVIYTNSKIHSRINNNRIRYQYCCTLNEANNEETLGFEDTASKANCDQTDTLRQVKPTENADTHQIDTATRIETSKSGALQSSAKTKVSKKREALFNWDDLYHISPKVINSPNTNFCPVNPEHSKIATANLGENSQNLSMQKRIENKVFKFSDRKNILYIYKSVSYCRSKQHSVIPATGILNDVNGKPIQININYCNDCEKCFIGKNEYDYYKKRYSVLLGNFKMERRSAFLDSSDYWNDYELAIESPLHLSGYNVSETDCMSEIYRRVILAFYMNTSISRKPEVIEYLNFFIKLNSKNSNKRTAVAKWKSDLDWVRNYNINYQIHFAIDEIRKNRK